MSRYSALARLPAWIVRVPLGCVLLSGVLVACSSKPPASTVQARCQAQVDDDPAVKAVLIKSLGMSGDPAWQEQLVQARRKSVDDCLSAAGLVVRGGVEPVSRARYGLGWY